MPEGCDRPNLIIITTDQQRYDTLGVTGNDIVMTPHLDALADRGTLFTRCYTQNTVCIPARACLHTGRYIHQHGVNYMEAEIDTTPGLPPWETTFMERLQRAGYYTGACGKIHMMRPKGYHWTQLTGGKGARWNKVVGQDIGPAPLGPDYAAWLENKRPGAYYELYEQRNTPEWNHGTAPIVLEEDEYVDYWAADMGIEFMRAQSADRPWLLWVGFCGPHPPFDPPRRYAEMYDPADMPFPETYQTQLYAGPDFARRPSKQTVSDEERLLVQTRVAYYYAMMTQIDDMVARLLAELERLGFSEDTVIMFTSDHGEMLGDWGHWGKGMFFEQIIRMPTIACVPEPWRAGDQPSRHEGVTETFSIASTALDYAGVEIPPEMAAPSWRPILEGGPGLDRPALTEYIENPERGASGMCFTGQRYKYAYWGPGCVGELYDLQDDPGERNNLWDDPGHADVRREMSELLLDRLLHSMDPAYTSFLPKLPSRVQKPSWQRS